jgi:hypothetical protein
METRHDVETVLPELERWIVRLVDQNRFTELTADFDAFGIQIRTQRNHADFARDPQGLASTATVVEKCKAFGVSAMFGQKPEAYLLPEGFVVVVSIVRFVDTLREMMDGFRHLRLSL